MLIQLRRLQQQRDNKFQQLLTRLTNEDVSILMTGKLPEVVCEVVRYIAMKLGLLLLLSYASRAM